MGRESCAKPPLTTIRQPIEAMGRAAVDRLDAQMDGDHVGPDELLFAPELVVRSSTAQPSTRLLTKLLDSSRTTVKRRGVERQIRETG